MSSEPTKYCTQALQHSTVHLILLKGLIPGLEKKNAEPMYKTPGCLQSSQSFILCKVYLCEPVTDLTLPISLAARFPLVPVR